MKDKPLPPSAALAYIAGYLAQSVGAGERLTLLQLTKLRDKADESLAAYTSYEVLRDDPAPAPASAEARRQ